MKNLNETPVTAKEILICKNIPVLKYIVEYPLFFYETRTENPDIINNFYEKRKRLYVNHIKTDLYNSAVRDFKFNTKRNFPVHEYEMVSNYNVEYNMNCVLSLYTDNYEYMGGAHGNTLKISETWDLKSQKQISLAALFPGNSEYENDVKTEIISQIEEARNNNIAFYFENYRELVDETFNPLNYYLTPAELVVYFQQYDIAPYSSGIVRFFIPYERVNASVPDCGEQR